MGKGTYIQITCNTFQLYNTHNFLLLFFCAIVKPVSVTILTKEKSVSAERRYEVECRTSGSRPEAIITWWKGNHQIKRMAKNVSLNIIILYM